MIQMKVVEVASHKVGERRHTDAGDPRPQDAVEEVRIYTVTCEYLGGKKVTFDGLTWSPEVGQLMELTFIAEENPALPSPSAPIPVPELTIKDVQEANAGTPLTQVPPAEEGGN